MNMENKFEPLHPENDVLSGISEELFDGRCTFTAGELLEAIWYKLNAQEEEYELFDEGIECKVLKPGKKWQKGKVRVTLEFCPDEPIQPPSPLDDLRKQIKETES